MCGGATPQDLPGGSLFGGMPRRFSVTNHSARPHKKVGFMRTVIQRPRILFVDGLPGSGKSTAAAEIGRRCPDSLVFREMHPNHPLLVGVPDRMGAAFGTIHRVHTADSFATMAIQKLDAF